MLTVFKKYQAYFLASETVVLALAAAFIHDKAPWSLTLSVVLGLSLLLLIFFEFRASLLHQKLLGVLYILLRPEDFVSAYSPLLRQKGIRKSVLLSMCAYLSNGLAAAGRFQEALQALDSAPVLSPGRRSRGEALLAGNRCSIYLSSGDISQAEQQYALMTEGLSKLSRVGSSLSETEQILSLRISAAKGLSGDKDADLVKNMLSRGGSALYKVQLKFLLGQIYRNLGEPGYARSFFSQAASEGGQTYLAARAAEEAEKPGRG